MSEPSFFSEMKKGEVNELRTQLRSAATEKDPQKLRGVLQKVISYMTLGIDMSPLFTDMVMVTNTRDLIQKKLVYLYLCNYAEANPELSLLTINTLQKDCRDDNPMVRGLALRSCSSLRIPNTVEYVVRMVEDGLVDASPYVRKTAVTGCGKLFATSHTHMTHSYRALIDKLYIAIRDKDPQVVVNALTTLNEILAEEGGVAINHAMALYLLNRFKDFNDWAQVSILELLSVKFTDATEQEVFDVLNLLDDKLRHSNSAVVLGVVKFFLKLTETIPQVHTQVFSRAKPSLLTLMEGSDAPELAFSVLSHIHVMVQKLRALTGGADVLFGAPGDHKHFMCAYNEPLYVRMLKLKVLRDIAAPGNVGEIVAELREQATSGDVTLAIVALRAIGEIAARMPAVAAHALAAVLELLQQPVGYISNTCILVLRDFLRVYPDNAPQVLDHIAHLVPTTEDSEAKEALVWILGFFGKSHENAPYLLEELVDKFDDETTPVKMAILTSSMRLLFSRPAEMQPILGRVFEKCLTLNEQPDLHDRALMYYRLLDRSSNSGDPNWVNTVSNVINSANAALGNTSSGGAFAEDESYDIRDKIFEEFNTLSIIYGKPAEEFIRKKPRSDMSVMQNGDSAHQDVEIMATPVEPALKLAPLPSFDPGSFQELWDKLDVGSTVVVQLQRAPSARNVEELMGQHGIMSLASGTVNSILKLYLYGFEEISGEYILVELLVDLKTLQLNASVKSAAPTSVLDEFAVQCNLWWAPYC